MHYTYKYLTPAFVLSAAFACTDFSAIEPDTCGNGVREASEDCDPLSEVAPPPGEVNQCRSKGDSFACRLDCRGSNKCPSGWGCDVEAKICRQPRTNAFADIGEPLRLGVVSTKLIDLDGDGRLDVLAESTVAPDQTSRVTILYFGNDGKLASALVVPNAVVSPTRYDIARDPVVPGEGERLLLSTVGIGVLAGTRDRSLRSELLTMFSAPTELGQLIGVPCENPILNGGIGHAPLTRTADEDPSSLFFYVGCSNERAVLGQFDPLGNPNAGDLAQRVLPFRIDAKSSAKIDILSGSPRRPLKFKGSPCSFVALIPPTPTSRVFLRGVATRQSPACADEQHTIMLPMGAVFTSAVVTHPDANDGLLFVSSSERSATLWQWNDLATDRATREGTVPTEAQAPSVLLQESFDRVGTPYLVTGQGILALPKASEDPREPDADAGANDAGADDPRTTDASLGDLRTSIVYGRIGTPWTAAAVGDFNGDGNLDLAAVSGRLRDTGAAVAELGAPGIDILLGNGEGKFIQRAHPTSVGITAIAVGDYDGDGTDDLAYAEPVDAPNQLGSANVFVLYGSRDSLFTDLRVVGQMENFVALRNAGVGSAGTGAYSAGSALAPKLLIIGEKRASVAVGGVERELLAPVFLPPVDTDNASSTELDPTGAVSGRFGPGGAPLVIASGARLKLTAGSNRRVSFFPYGLDANLPKADLVNAQPGKVESPILGTFRVVFNKRRRTSDEIATGIGKQEDGSGKKTTQLFEILVRDGKQLQYQAKAPLEGKTGGQLQSVDVNEDGFDDLVLNLEPENQADPRSPTTTAVSGKFQVIAFFGRSDGSLDPNPVTVLDGGRSFAIRRDPEALSGDHETKKIQLLVLTTNGEVKSIRWRAGKFIAEEKSVLDANAQRTSISIGDVTGDGIDDLIITDNGAVRVFKGQAEKP
jgi:FG-GAP repeat